MFLLNLKLTTKKRLYELPLQYKMFLLNEVGADWDYSRTTFTIQNVPIKFSDF